MKLFLCGDVMTGRGIDQILRAPRDVPGLRPKGIHYRMSPPNAACLAAARVDCCVLANNHVLDWGRQGLEDTLDTMEALGIAAAGAGRNGGQAQAPARVGGGLLVFAFGVESAGVPVDWAAHDAEPGVSFLPDLSSQTTDAAIDLIGTRRAPGERLLVSMHWGSNWGYEVARQKRSFARRLIDAGAADLVHGHSSHHPRGFEIYRDRLILYGCGDFLNDYEGIEGHEAFRPQLALMYFPVLAASGELTAFTLAPMRVHCFRLQRASDEEAGWLAALLGRESRMPVARMPDGLLHVR